jgi:hypothetical protein
VKHKIEGGMVPFQTVEMQPAWEALGMNQEEYQEYLDGLPLGRKYVLKWAGIEQGVVERAEKLLALPEKASDHASATSPAVRMRSRNRKPRFRNRFLDPVHSRQAVSVASVQVERKGRMKRG